MTSNDEIWKKIDKDWETTDTSECGDTLTEDKGGSPQAECDETLCPKHHEIYREEVAEAFRADERAKFPLLSKADAWTHLGNKPIPKKQREIYLEKKIRADQERIDKDKYKSEIAIAREINLPKMFENLISEDEIRADERAKVIKERPQKQSTIDNIREGEIRSDERIKTYDTLNKREVPSARALAEMRTHTAKEIFKELDNIWFADEEPLAYINLKKKMVGK